MKIKDSEHFVDASYNTIKKFVLRNPDFFYKDDSGIINITDIGLTQLQQKYGHKSNVISESDERVYQAKISLLMQQLDIANKYGEVFSKQLAISTDEIEQSRLTIKELEAKLQESTINNLKLEHRLEMEINKSLWKKIFTRRGRSNGEQ